MFKFGQYQLRWNVYVHSLALSDIMANSLGAFGTIVAPLTQLTSKDGFCWNSEAVKAFLQLKEALTTAPILQVLDFSQKFEVEYDACGTDIGVLHF